MINTPDQNDLSKDVLYCLDDSSGDIVKAEISHLLRLAQYGDGLFESIRCENARAPLLTHHLDRLKKSASYFHFDVADQTWSFWELQLKRLIRGNREPIRLKLVLTRIGLGKYTPKEKKGVLLFKIEELAALEPISAGTHLEMDRTEFPHHPLGNHKSCSALPYVLAGIRSEKNTNSQIVLHSIQAGVIEAESSNLFLKIGQDLVTPHLDSGCLNGVMRNVVLAWCQDWSIACVQRKVKPAELLEADEIFLTNAVLGALPVDQFEDRKLNDHELCLRIRKKYHEEFFHA